MTTSNVERYEVNMIGGVVAPDGRQFGYCGEATVAVVAELNRLTERVSELEKERAVLVGEVKAWRAERKAKIDIAFDDTLDSDDINDSTIEEDEAAMAKLKAGADAIEALQKAMSATNSLKIEGL